MLRLRVLWAQGLLKVVCMFGSFLTFYKFLTQYVHDPCGCLQRKRLRFCLRCSFPWDTSEIRGVVLENECRLKLGVQPMSGSSPPTFPHQHRSLTYPYGCGFDFLPMLRVYRHTDKHRPTVTSCSIILCQRTVHW